MMDKVKMFAQMLEDHQKEECHKNKLDSPGNIEQCKTTVKDGPKYIKVNVGPSGKYMIEKTTEKIFGIKGYGVIHRGHQYGTLDTIDDWYWGGYTGMPKK